MSTGYRGVGKELTLGNLYIHIRFATRSHIVGYTTYATGGRDPHDVLYID